MPVLPAIAPARRELRLPACTRFARMPSPAQPAEILGPRLLSLHNLRFVLDLVAGACAAIEAGDCGRTRRKRWRGATFLRRGNVGYVIVLVALFGLMWFLPIRPPPRGGAARDAGQAPHR
jgi:hypothetical protein